MIKVISFLLIFFNISYGAGLNLSAFGNLADIKSSGAKVEYSQELTEEEAKAIKKHIVNLERTQQGSPDEFLMLAVTYEAGHKKIGIGKNFDRAIFYYEKAMNKGLVYGGIRGSVLAYENNKKDKASEMLYSSLELKNITYDEGLILNRLGALYALNSKKYGEASLFIEELAFVFKDSEAAYLGFNMYYYGMGVKKNPVLATKFINAACNSPKITQNVANFCLTSPLLKK